MSLGMILGHMKVVQSQSHAKVSQKVVVECPSCVRRSPLTVGLRYKTRCA